MNLDKNTLREIANLLKEELLPIGSILIYPSENIPDSFLACDGSELSKKAYPDLYALIKGTWGEMKDTFFLPDLQGQFIRGWDKEQNIDPGRNLGNVQEDALQGHGHKVLMTKALPQQPMQMTIHPQTVNKMAEGVIYLLERGAIVHPNVAFEKYEWFPSSISEYGRQLAILLRYYIEHPEKPKIIQFVHDLNEYANCIDNHKSQKSVCGAGNGFKVFDVDGNSYPCHILSPLVLEGTDLNEIQNGVINTIADFSDPKCIKCPYVSSCPTCIACNYLYRGRFQKRDDTHCKIMRIEVKAYIKKEILRLKLKPVLTPEDAVLIDSIRKLVDYEKFS